jgi:ankyrin repeat protein
VTQNLLVVDEALIPHPRSQESNPRASNGNSNSHVKAERSTHPIKMARTSGIEHLPVEVFDDIIKHLVLAIGIYRAVALRRVNRKFDAAVMHAICVRRVVDVQDHSTPFLLEGMSLRMRGKIFLQPPRPTDSDIQIYMSVVAATNQALDAYYTSDHEQARNRRHQNTAENICIPNWRDQSNFGLSTSSLELVVSISHQYLSDGILLTVWKQQPNLEDAVTRAQNLLSAAVLAGDTTLVDAIVKSELRTALSPTQATWTPFFHRPLTLAAAAGNLELVTYLLRSGFRLDHNEGIDLVAKYIGPYSGYRDERCRREEAPTLFSAHHKRIDWSRIALCGNHPLFAAAFNGHIDVLRLLLQDEHRLPLDNGIYLRAILAGALAGRPDIVELLLRVIQCSVADIVNLDKMLVYHSVKSGNVAMVATLEQWGIDLNQQLLNEPNSDPPQFLFREQVFSSALQIAAFKGDIPMIEFLLSRRPDVHHGNSWQRGPPVEWAAQRGHLEAVQLLLDHGSSPSFALIGASSTGQVHIIKYLLGKYPSIVDRDYEKAYQLHKYVTGQRALLLATRACHLETMTILVQAGANPSHGPNAPMSRRNLPSGRRPLVEAWANGTEWVLDHLISLGAKPNVLDGDMKGDGHGSGWGSYYCNGIRPSEHTWQWMNKY